MHLHPALSCLLSSHSVGVGVLPPHLTPCSFVVEWQEDAHEFLRWLLSMMHEECLKKVVKPWAWVYYLLLHPSNVWRESEEPGGFRGGGDIFQSRIHASPQLQGALWKPLLQVDHWCTIPRLKSWVQRHGPQMWPYTLQSTHPRLSM